MSSPRKQIIGPHCLKQRILHLSPITPSSEKDQVNRQGINSSDFPAIESRVFKQSLIFSHTLYCEFWRAVLSLVVIGSESVCPIPKSETQLDLFVLIDAVPAETWVELLSLWQQICGLFLHSAARDHWHYSPKVVFHRR